jgi:MinD superfamily P-loop ATPase
MTKPLEIAVVSGKGGTGKTVLTSSLAALAESKVIADCDVDAPDMHLLLKPTILKQEAFYGMKTASIDPQKCTSCGGCFKACKFRAVLRDDTSGNPVYRVDQLACEGCGVCSWICPSGAVRLEESPTGTWYISDTPYGKLVHASLGAARENSGMLVSVVRREARLLAQQKGAGLVIIDGPPGIGCPVIATVTGTDMVIAVTEPTLSGLHDLKRVVELSEHFGVQAGAVINKYDLNSAMCAEIERFLLDRGIGVLGRIPFSREVNKAVADGRVVVEGVDGKPAEAIRQIWAGIESLFPRTAGTSGRSK